MGTAYAVKLGASKATQRPASRSRIVGSLRGRVCGWKGKLSELGKRTDLVLGVHSREHGGLEVTEGNEADAEEGARTVGSMWLNEQYCSVAAGRTCYSQGHLAIFCVSYEVKSSCEQGGIQGVW